MSMFVVNDRTLLGGLTGAQRYLLEIGGRLDIQFKHMIPATFGQGMWGHLWEQTVLPLRLEKKEILWSPSNTGPVSCRRQLLTLHDIAPIDHPEWFGRRFSEWFNFLVPKLARNVHRIITVSNFSKERIVDACGVDDDKVDVVFNGANEKFGACDTKEVIDITNQFGCQYKRYLLTVGSIEPRKNLARLLAAWKRVQGVLDDDILLIVAGGAGNAVIFNDVNLPANIPNVRFVGRVSDNVLPALYQGALGFVYLSVYEGFGLPVLEAMASGAAVLTSNQTALLEVAGDAGLTVNPYSIDAIAEGLQALCMDSSLVDRLSVAGSVRAANFSWDIAAKMTTNIFNQTMRDLV